MMISNQSSSDDTDKQQEEHNVRPSIVRKRQTLQKTTLLAPFLADQETVNRNNEKLLVDRKNSDVSTATTTSNSTQADHAAADVVLRRPQSDDSGLDEVSPPKTPATRANPKEEKTSLPATTTGTTTEPISDLERPQSKIDDSETMKRRSRSSQRKSSSKKRHSSSKTDSSKKGAKDESSKRRSSRSKDKSRDRSRRDSSPKDETKRRSSKSKEKKRSSSKQRESTSAEPPRKPKRKSKTHTSSSKRHSRSDGKVDKSGDPSKRHSRKEKKSSKSPKRRSTKKEEDLKEKNTTNETPKTVIPKSPTAVLADKDVKPSPSKSPAADSIIKNQETKKSKPSWESLLNKSEVLHQQSPLEKPVAEIPKGPSEKNLEDKDVTKTNKESLKPAPTKSLPKGSIEDDKKEQKSRPLGISAEKDVKKFQSAQSETPTPEVLESPPSVRDDTKKRASRPTPGLGMLMGTSEKNLSKTDKEQPTVSSVNRDLLQKQDSNKKLGMVEVMMGRFQQQKPKAPTPVRDDIKKRESRPTPSLGMLMGSSEKDLSKKDEEQPTKPVNRDIKKQERKQQPALGMVEAMMGSFFQQQKPKSPTPENLGLVKGGLRKEDIMETTKPKDLEEKSNKISISKPANENNAGVSAVSASAAEVAAPTLKCSDQESNVGDWDSIIFGNSVEEEIVFFDEDVKSKPVAQTHIVEPKGEEAKKRAEQEERRRKVVEAAARRRAEAEEVAKAEEAGRLHAEQEAKAEEAARATEAGRLQAEKEAKAEEAARAEKAGRLQAEQEAKARERKQLERPSTQPSSNVHKLKLTPQSSDLKGGVVRVLSKKRPSTPPSSNIPQSSDLKGGDVRVLSKKHPSTSPSSNIPQSSDLKGGDVLSKKLPSTSPSSNIPQSSDLKGGDVLSKKLPSTPPSSNIPQSSDLKGGDVLSKKLPSTAPSSNIPQSSDSNGGDVRVLSKKLPSTAPSSNVHKLKFAPQSSDLKSGDVLSKSPAQNIDSIQQKPEEDEEAQLVTTPALAKEFKHATKRFTEGASGKSVIGSGSDAPDGSKEKTLERAATTRNHFVEEKGAAARTKSPKLLCVMFFLFAAIVGATFPFVKDMIVTTSAAIETLSPSTSMGPSSSPSLSQVPSPAPSSNPSIYPTLSAVPTIAPSGRPTLSTNPSMSPTISGAPTMKPSTEPTESMEPSAYPSEIPSIVPTHLPSATPSVRPTVSMEPSSFPSSTPSQSPSSGPTQHPTTTFQPSRYPTPSPTKRPTTEPTRNPTRMPITPPPPDAFKIRLHWDPSYFWQETTAEAWWCMECVKCDEYGGMDAPDHGCVSYGTGDGSRCQAGDSIWVRDCRSRGNHFIVQKSAGREFMLRIARTNLCVERIKDKHPFLFLQGCEEHNQYQRFNPWNNYNKFELRPPGMRDCVSQAHHPKSGELVSLHNCGLAKRDETLYWERY